MFRFGTLTPFWCFRRLLHSEYYSLIQNLHFQYTVPPQCCWTWQSYTALVFGVPPYNRAVWKDTWDEIGNMKGLRSVRVDIKLESKMHAEIEGWFLSPLEGLGDSVKNEVRVNWRLDEAGPPGKEWPFTFRRNMFCHEHIDGSFRLEPEAGDPDCVGLHASMLTPEQLDNNSAESSSLWGYRRFR
jgi:hypothetical protein